MKLAKIIAFFVIVALAIPAQAKVVYNGNEFQDMHVHAVKGFIYDMVQSQSVDIKKQVAPGFTKALVWLERSHKDKKTFDLDKIKTENTSVIRASIKYLSDIAADKYPDIPSSFIGYWITKGQKVIAKYEMKGSKLYWVLKLKETPKK